MESRYCSCRVQTMERDERVLPQELRTRGIRGATTVVPLKTVRLGIRGNDKGGNNGCPSQTLRLGIQGNGGVLVFFIFC